MAIHDRLETHFQTIGDLEAEKAELQSCLKRKVSEIEGLRRTFEQLQECYSVLNQGLHQITIDSSNDTSSREAKCIEKTKARKHKSIKTNGNRKCERVFLDYQAVKAFTSDADAKLTAALLKHALGSVKWYNAKTGYGFINHHDTHEDVFVHRTAITPNKD